MNWWLDSPVDGENWGIACWTYLVLGGVSDAIFLVFFVPIAFEQREEEA